MWCNLILILGVSITLTFGRNLLERLRMIVLFLKSLTIIMWCIYYCTGFFYYLFVSSWLHTPKVSVNYLLVSIKRLRCFGWDKLSCIRNIVTYHAGILTSMEFVLVTWTHLWLWVFVKMKKLRTDEFEFKTSFRRIWISHWSIHCEAYFPWHVQTWSAVCASEITTNLNIFFKIWWLCL